MFRFIKELKSTILNNSPLKEAVIFSTDTKELFIDIDNNRMQICDIINIDTLNNLDNILASNSDALIKKFIFKMSNTWSSVSKLPNSFYQGSVIVLDNEIHILGSYYNSNNILINGVKLK